MERSTLVISPDSEARMQLRYALTSSDRFLRIMQTGQLETALDKISEDRCCDVFFISTLLDSRDVTEFIRKAKSSEAGQDSAYVLVIQGDEQKASEVCSHVLAGADALLFEPYSINSLIEIVEIALKIRQQRSEARELAAFEILLNDIMNLLDHIAYSEGRGYSSSAYRRQLTKTCAVLSNLESSSIKRFLGVAQAMFVEVPPPKRIYQRQQYGGASNRIKRLLNSGASRQSSN